MKTLVEIDKYFALVVDKSTRVDHTQLRPSLDERSEVDKRRTD